MRPDKIGIYGGTFDPVHSAHLVLARDALEQLQLEKVIFVPAAASPQKKAPLAPPQLRLEMLSRAIAGERCFEVENCELARPAPSYTTDTIEYLAGKWPNAQLFLLLGDDNLAALPDWHRYEDLRRMVTFVILRRTEMPVAHDYLRVERIMEISATEIRRRVAAGESFRYLVPETVHEIICAQQLYRRCE